MSNRSLSYFPLPTIYERKAELEPKLATLEAAIRSPLCSSTMKLSGLCGLTEDINTMHLDLKDASLRADS